MGKLKYPKLHKHLFEPRAISEDGKYWYGKCSCKAISGNPIKDQEEFKQIYKQLIEAGHAW